MLRTSARIEKTKINSPWLALRNSIAVALPLAIGIAIGDPLGGVAVTTGALNVSYADGTDPYTQRGRRMLLWTALGALAVFVGSVTGKYHWAAVLVAAAWAFGAGMCVAISQRAGDLGLNTLVAVIVFSARGALPLKGAAIAALLVMLGGLLQTFIALLAWPLRAHNPERRVVGEEYGQLAREVKPDSNLLTTGPGSAPSPQVQDTIAALGRDHSIEGERLRLIFDQADRIRLSTYLIHRLYSEVKHSAKTEAAIEKLSSLLDELLDVTSRLLAAVSECLMAGGSFADVKELLSRLASISEALQLPESDVGAKLAHEVASAADTLAGQLRAVTVLTAHSIPEGLESFARREAAQPWRLQLGSWIGTLRANLDLRSAAFRHAIRLMICVSIADALGRGVLNWQRSYWLPMTVAVVLKPDFAATFSRGLSRLAGTFAGLALATFLYNVLPASALTQLFLVGAFTFAMRLLGPANYGVFSIAISGLIVFLIAATGISPRDVVIQRAENTVAGGIFALIAYALWPTWEQMQVSDVIAGMLEACRLYFQAIVRRFAHEDSGVEAELDDARRTLRRARSNAEASVDRVTSEPRIGREKLDSLTSILATSHALMYAMLSLEAGVIQRERHTAPDVFEKFATDVEFTLYFLSSALRGSVGAIHGLPKLREDHRKLMQARDRFSPLDEFVLIETDHLTTALNTLREQIMRYVGVSQPEPGASEPEPVAVR